MLQKTFKFGSALFNLIVSILYIIPAFGSFLLQLASQWRLLLVAFAVGGGSMIITQYFGTWASNVEFVMRCRVNEYYVSEIRPILAGIIRQFFNRIICWYDAFVWYPYGLGRYVIFPILRDGGFGPTVSALADFFKQVGKDMFLDFFFTSLWFTEPLDFTNIYAKWQIFWTLWQNLWCYGCQDLCPIYTKLPIIPMFLTSDQGKDIEFLSAHGNAFNGLLAFTQQMIFLAKDILYPEGPTRIYADFSATFEFFCAANIALVKSWENAMQNFWDYFIPFNFVWKDMLCVISVWNCSWLRFFNLMLNLIIHAGSVVSFFDNTDRTYWITTVRYSFTIILNMWSTATYFNPILVPIQNTSQVMNITSYQLTTTEPSTPWGAPNPLFGTNTGAGCLCIAVTRILCDPMNNGTTCAQRFNGTLLTYVEPCCFINATGTMIADFSASIFEFTLHLFSFEDFILYLDQQPFTTQLKDNSVAAVSCLFNVFQSIKVYGFCITRILSEMTLFWFSTLELFFRVIIGFLTLPFFNFFLPQTCNFISCPGNSALNMTVQYLERISDSSNPDGLINCMCYILNNGFNVPFAGCHNISCVPTGFVQPSQKKRNLWNKGQESFYNYAVRSIGLQANYPGITPIIQYKHNKKDNDNPIEFTLDDLKKIPPDAFMHLDNALKQTSSNMKCSAVPYNGLDKRDLIYNNITTPPLNCTDPNNPPPCFNLCCLPVALIKLTTHTILSNVRAINAAFETRFTDGSTYWDGTACTMGEDCLASDLVEGIVLFFAPVACLCDFIKLVLPPQGFGDPCCAFTVAGELVSVFVQIIINVGNSVAGGGPDFYYIRGSQNFSTTNSGEDTGIPLVNDFTVLLSLARTLFDCICNFIRTIFAVVLSGFNITKAFDPCCTFRVYFRAILELTRTAFRLILALTQLDSVPAQQFLYVNGYKNARPFCPFFIGDVGIVKELKNVTRILLQPPIEPRAQMTCSGTLPVEAFHPDNEGLPTCLCSLLTAIFAMINRIDDEFKGDLNASEAKCNLNICCGLFAYGKFLKNVADLAIELIATIWQNWEYKENFVVAPSIAPVNFFFPQETLNYLFCNEYAGLKLTDPKFPDGTPNPYYSVSYLSVAMTQTFYAPFVQNKPGYKSGYIPNTNPNATIGVVNPNAVYDPNNPQLRLMKCGRVEPALADIQALFQNCLCMGGNTSQEFSYTQSYTQATCSLTNPTANGIANMLDVILRWLLAFVTSASQIFPFQLLWPACLCCGGGPGSSNLGIVIPFGNMLTVGLRQVIEMIRNIPNPTYWTMNGGSLLDTPVVFSAPEGFVLTNLNYDLDDIRRTWINRFLAPFADAACSFFTNCGCLLSMILGSTCQSQRYMLLSSALRYYWETYIQLFSLIEGFIKLISHEQPNLCVGGPPTQGNNAYTTDAKLSQGSTGGYKQLVPTCSPQAGGVNGFTWRGINGDQLGRIVGSALQYVIDALYGFSELSCSALCPTQQTQDSACACYNLSPYVNWGDIPPDRCALAWFYFIQVNGWVTMWGRYGQNNNLYPPGTAGRAPDGSGGTQSWENHFCEKNINYYGSLSGACGNICYIWFQETWCNEAQYGWNFTLNPSPGNKAECAAILMGQFASFSGQSMQSKFSTKVWHYTSTKPCPGSDVTLNYCKAEPRFTRQAPLIVIPGVVSTTAYIMSTILQTSSLTASVPILSQINGTQYNASLCDSPNYMSWYGSSITRPYGIDLWNPANTNFSNANGVKVDSPYYGSCYWFETMCTQENLWNAFKLYYSYANLIYQTTELFPPNPWQACCLASWGVANWTQYLNSTQQAQYNSYFGPLGMPVSFFNAYCNDPRYDQFRWVVEMWPPGCNQQDMIAKMFQLIRGMMRNCIYAGVNSYDLSFLTYQFALGAANEAAFTCQGVPTCIPGGQANGLNVDFAQRWNDLETSFYVSFNYILNIAPLLRSVGQCATCRVEASGCKVIGAQNKTYQPVCSRTKCINSGWCKNDLLVPCSALTNPMILDGVVIAVLKYGQCLSIQIFGQGNGLTDFIGIAITILKWLWQLSGALVRLVVNVVLICLDIMVTFFQDLSGGVLNFLLSSLLGPFKIAIIVFNHFQALFNSFKAIFQTPIVSRSHVDVNGYQNLVINSVSYLYQFSDGHECIDDSPIYCICKAMNIRETCHVVANVTMPSGITLIEVLNKASQEFDNETNCGMLYQHLAQMQLTNWTFEVPYADRYEAMDCLSKRSQSEQIHRMIPEVPVDFFYNPYSMYMTIINIFGPYLSQQIRTIREDHSRITSRSFKEHFGMSMDEFGRSINLRGYRVQEYYQKVLRMKPDSIMWDPMLKMDMYYFKYRVGYYHYLWDSFSFNRFVSRHSGPGLRAHYAKNVADEWNRIGDHARTAVTNITEYYGVDNLYDIIVPHVETPQLIRMAMEGSLWQGIKNMWTFYPPVTSRIQVRIPPWSVAPIEWWPRIEWTPQITRNWEAGKRLLFQFAHVLWPQHTTREQHERFIENGQCLIFDGAVNLGTLVLGYCIEEFVENTPTTRNSPLGRYIKTTSPFRHKSFFNSNNNIVWQNNSDNTYVRPRIIAAAPKTNETRHVFNRLIYRRAMNTVKPTGWAGIFLDIIDSIFGIDLLQTLDDWTMTFMTWVSNSNTNPADYPNVGAKYWFQFMIRCEFPYNLNCSIGVRLGTALWQVGVVYLTIFIALAVLFPQVLSLVSIVFNLIVYAIIVAIVAWHYSPACIMLFPAMTIQESVTVPVLPIPLNFFPALPMCLWDDILSVLDNVFASCYTWIPQWSLNTPQCVPCDQRLGFTNCVDVGIVNPLDVITFLGYRIFGSWWCDLMISISSAFSWLPFIGVDRTVNTCYQLQTASDTQYLRQGLCGGFGFGVLAWVLAILYAVGVFLGTVGFALLLVLMNIVSLIPFLWFVPLLTGVDKPKGYFVVDGEELRVEQKDDVPTVSENIIRRWFTPHMKIE